MTKKSCEHETPYSWYKTKQDNVLRRYYKECPYCPAPSAENNLRDIIFDYLLENSKHTSEDCLSFTNDILKAVAKKIESLYCQHHPKASIEEGGCDTNQTILEVINHILEAK